MTTIALKAQNDFGEWRGAARGLLLGGVAPDEVHWRPPGDADDLFAEAPRPDGDNAVQRAVGVVPQRFIELAEAAICHRDPERFALLYRLLWRLQKDRTLLEARSDPDVSKLYGRAGAVRRDSHKMTAFVRFRSLGALDGRERFAAWFEPDHYIVERTAPFFVRRFAGMNWAIVTPERAACWDGEALSFGPGGDRASVPAQDALEDVWRAYFASIFNPARLKVSMMKSEMPVKYWKNLPEARLIPELIRSAGTREADMIAQAASQPPARHLRQGARLAADVPAAEITTLAEAREAVVACVRCPLYEHATQPVFGAGPPDARIMVVGEQPGDHEDLAGRPFVGPAGQVFDAALAEVGLDRAALYITNAVKHFKFEPRGKRRIHQKPNAGEIQTCKFWLDLELKLVRPKLIVAMGGSAATSLLDRKVAINRLRGQLLQRPDGTPLIATVHPSYLLRLPDPHLAKLERERFVADLAMVRDFSQSLAA